MFKVGSKVKIIKTNWSGRCKEELGKIGYIVEDYGLDCDKRWEVRNSNSVNGEYLGLYNNDELELIESPKKKEVKEEKAEENRWEYKGIPIIEREDCPNGMFYFMNGDSLTGLIDFGFSKPKKKVMATLSNIAKKILDPDLRALVEVGYLDSELELTDEGEEAVLELMFFANKEELAKQAKKELKERKKDK